jgi:hypothetical protein
MGVRPEFLRSLCYLLVKNSALDSLLARAGSAIGAQKRSPVEEDHERHEKFLASVAHLIDFLDRDRHCFQRKALGSPDGFQLFSHPVANIQKDGSRGALIGKKRVSSAPGEIFSLVVLNHYAQVWDVRGLFRA